MEGIEKLVNVEEAARLLALKPATVRRLAAEGTLPVIRPTGRRAVRFRLSDVRALVDAPASGDPESAA